MMKTPQKKHRIEYQLYSHLSPRLYPLALAVWYFRRTGKILHLRNPRTFNEKINWLKLYDSTPLKSRLSDKYLVRKWVEKKLGPSYLIPLLGVWDRPEDIDFSALPDRFVLKANHGCHWNIIVKDKAALDIPSAMEKMRRWMNTDFTFVFGFQMHYRRIRRKILAEAYMEDQSGELQDYKIFCFNGRPAYIWVDVDRTGNHVRYIYDMDWNPAPFAHNCPKGPGELPPPECFGEMKRIAEILCKGFPFVRVDLYQVENQVYFGEMTFTTGSGQGWFSPKEWNLKLGEMITLPPAPRASR